MGCAPSASVLATWNQRESELVSLNTLDRVVANLPNPQNTHAGSASSDLKSKIAHEGARTIPGRPEHGGNCDIKNLSRGSKTYLPVHVPGAKFSVGDLHFSQGDGEISFCGAIEMAGIITFRFSLMKGGIEALELKSPIFIPGPVEPSFGPGRMLTFEGFSVDEGGRQHYMDVTVAYRQTCLRVFEYLKRFGYSGGGCYGVVSLLIGWKLMSNRADISPPFVCASARPYCRSRGCEYPFFIMRSCSNTRVDSKCVHDDGHPDGYL